MAKITKPDMTYVWASGGSKTAPSSVKIQTGWIVEKPEFEKMNWVQNRQDDSLAYIFQMGVPEWDSAVEYQYSATYKSYVQRNGLVYKALQVGTNKDPASEAAYWTVAFDDKGSADSVQANLTTHITNYGTLASLSNAATARTNLDVYSKAEAAEKNGDATKLFSVANGTTGNEAVNKTQLDAKAEKNGSNSETFSVNTATEAAHAVRKDQFDAKTGVATDTIAGIVEKATQAEMNAGAANVWPDAATIFDGFIEGANYFRFPAWMGGWFVKWDVVTVGDILPSGAYGAHEVVYPIPGFTTINNVLIGTTTGEGHCTFTVHRRSFNNNSVTVWLKELASEIQTDAGFWVLAIGK